MDRGRNILNKQSRTAFNGRSARLSIWLEVETLYRGETAYHEMLRHISTHQIQRNNKTRKGEKATYRRVECVRTRLLDICK
jgi:hypothetical protein